MKRVQPHISSPLAISLALGLLTFMISGFIARVAYLAHNPPATQDEYSILYQAQIYLTGHMRMPMRPELRAFKELYMLFSDTGIFSKYPPGLTLLVTLAMPFGAADLVNPLLSALAVVLVAHVVASQLGWTIALCTGLLLATNAYFLAYSASLFTQPPSLFLSAAGMFLFLRYTQTRSPKYLRWLGAAAGALAFVRPLESVCLMLPTSLLLLNRADVKTSLRHITTVALPMLAGWLLLIGFNWIQADCLCLAPYPIFTTHEFHVVPDESKGFFSSLLDIISGYYNNFSYMQVPLFRYKFISYVGPAFLTLAALGLCRKWNRIMMFAAVYAAGIVLLYNFHQTHGYPTFGSRYWYPALISLSLFAAYPLAAIRRRAPELLPTFMFILLSIQCWQSYEDISVYHRRAVMRQLLQDDVDMMCPEPALVIMNDTFEKPENWPGYIVTSDLHRNPFINGPRLYLREYDHLARVQPFYPDYMPCDYFLIPSAIPIPPQIHPLLNWDLAAE
ncbi:MAG: hypothetical protein EBV03_01215 [Proteobacteria bacterium]|nr:hypothetical protein [Pseudomonadota bacterium]